MTRVDAQRPAVYVERALAAATLPCVAYVHENTAANLRWAGNTLTTNGEMSSRTLTVTATAEVTGGAATGTVSQDVADLSEVPVLVAAAEAAARSGPVSPDAAEPVLGGAAAGLRRSPREHLDRGLAQVASELGVAFGAAAARDIALYGFAEHIVTTSYLGSSTGLRRRAVQPSGRFELNGKSDAGRLRLDRPAHADLHRRRRGTAAGRTGHPARVGRAPDRPAARSLRDAAATRTGRRPDDLPVLDRQCAGRRGGPERLRGPGGGTTIGNRFSDLAITLRSDPGYPGLEALPYVDFTASPDGTGWAFDAGAPIDPSTGSPTACTPN